MISGNIGLTRLFRRGPLIAFLSAFFLILCLGCLGVGPAEGYVLEGPYILELMARNLGGAATLRVAQKVTIEDPAVAAEPVTLEETLSYIFPGRFRSEMVYQGTRRVQVISDGQTMTIVDNRITGNPKGRIDQYKDLLLYNSAPLLARTLAVAGVDVGVTSLGRLGDTVVYVIGARYPDESAPQVWVDKEQFVPLRWILPATGDGAEETADRWEFLYDGWQKVGGVAYPFRIETLRNGQRIRLIQVTKADVNAVIDAGSVDIAHLRSLYPQQEVPPLPGDQPASRIDAVQSIIEKYQKKFEP